MPAISEALNVLQTRFRLDPRSWSEIQNEVKCWSFPLSDLLEEESRMQALRQIKDLLGTANLSVASSMLVKRFSFAFLIPLALFSLYQKKIVSPTWNVALLTPSDSDSIWVPNIAMDLSEIQDVDSIQRSQERTKLFRWMFQQHFSQWIQGIRMSVKISENTLWENVYVYIQWMYQSMIGEVSSKEAKKQIEEDYLALVTDPDLPLTWEGRNPFVAFYETTLCRPKGEPITRQTCCLAYLTSRSHQHCKTCPASCKIRESSC